MNNLVFSTGGDWDSTTLFNDGQEVMAAQMYVELHAGRDIDGDLGSGGVSLGGDMTAIIRPQDNPQQEVGIFPGRLQMTFPGHELVIENTHPAFAFEFTQIWYQGHDVSNNVVDLLVDIDAVNNNVKAYITIYKPHWFGSDEVATYNIL
jgi:hypothetical protein